MSVPGPVLGPCESWIDGADIAACCSPASGADPDLLDSLAVEASMALFEISGRQFTGLCGPTTVRPCRTPCSHWPASAGGPWYWGAWPFGTGSYSWSDGWWNGDSSRMGCSSMSRVRLSGYPVREIVSVTIDGVDVPELDSDGDPNWRLDGWRWLTRMNKPGNPVVKRRWPGCQDMSLDDTEPGTFAVTYRHGVDPPQLGRDAAAEIACQLYAACSGSGECTLPAGVTRLVRQGVEVERGLLANWMDPAKPTGLVHVDLFLRAYWQGRGRRKGAIWTPDLQGFARPLGS